MDITKVIIIGAGMAGLSAGCYLQMCGFDTEIFEIAATPGGLCTGWKRQGYSFDGCIHWLVGTRPTVNFYDIWNELIDMEHLDVVDYDEYCALEDENGNRFTAYTDIDKLEKEMKRVSPEDSAKIDAFIAGIRGVFDFSLPVERPMDLMSFSEKLFMAKTMLPMLPKLMKWYKITNAEFAAQLHSPLLKRFFTSAYPGQFTMMVTLINCGWLHKKGAGYPIGGSAAFTQKIAQRYQELGGKFHFNSKVDKIQVKDHSACGVVVGNQFYPADYVVSAADGRSTIYQLLEGKYKDKKIVDRYEKNKLERSAPMMFFSVGVNKSFDEYPHWLFLPLKNKIHIDSKTEISELTLTIVNYDKTAAAPGKTCMTLMLSGNDCEHWTNLRSQNKEQYKKEKELICQQLLDALEDYFKDFKEHVEVYDLATPATYIRYTENWQASSQGWSASKKSFGKMISKKIKGLQHFYMAGQWVEVGGGVPMCMMSGRNISQLICKETNTEFHH